MHDCTHIRKRRKGRRGCQHLKDAPERHTRTRAHTRSLRRVLSAGIINIATQKGGSAWRQLPNAVVSFSLSQTHTPSFSHWLTPLRHTVAHEPASRTALDILFIWGKDQKERIYYLHPSPSKDLILSSLLMSLSLSLSLFSTIPVFFFFFFF